jgi:hypothetical protein
LDHYHRLLLITTHQAAKSLPFVCRFEDATARKPKQNLTQFGKAKDSVKAKR